MESSQFLWRRFQVSLDLLVIIVPAYLANVYLLTYSFGSLLPGFVLPWATASTVTASAWLGTAWLVRRSSSVPFLVVSVTMSAFALVLSLLYSWFLREAYPLSEAPGQQVLFGFSVALLCMGAVTLSSLPWAALAWIAGLFAGLLGSILSDVPGASPIHWIMFFSLVLVLGLFIVTYQRLFRVRLLAETQAARQSEMVGMLLHEFENDAQDWIWETDAQGCLKTASHRLSTLLGRPPQDLIGRSMVELMVVDRSRQTIEDEEDLSSLAAAFAGSNAFRDLEVPVQGATQYRRWRLSGKPVYDEAATLTGWRGVGSDITEVQRLNNLNAQLALLDNLTGLANRNRLQAVLHDHLSPRSGGRPCGLILIDLQGFRMVNEGLGHEVGDHLLRSVAQRLRTRVPTSALLARLGGDEFALIAPEAGEEALEGLVAALASACDEPILIDGHRLEITFHMGVAAAPRDAGSATELLKCAELALHEAKVRRQGLAVVYQTRLGDRARDRLRLQGELKVALLEGQFELHYQPQIRLSDAEVIGCEALVRWRHPGRGLVSPAEFIPVLEETGLIVPLGIWILEAACREASTWSGNQQVAVNVSAVQFASRTFFESVKGVLAATGFPPSRLELEITESVMAQDPKAVVQQLRDLRDLGLSVALDDFGTGYSSLSYVRQLPLDKLKVDQSFVRVLGQDENAAAIVQTVLGLSKVLGLKTTAEGVETEAQRDLLLSMGCDSVQGYLYAKPLPAPALAEFMGARGRSIRS